MIVSPKIPRKLNRLAQTYESLVFEPAAMVPAEFLETREHLRAVPGDGEEWRPAGPGTEWGAPWTSAWFRGEFRVTPELAGRALFLRARTDALEALLWIDGKPAGIFTHARDGAQIGNHHALLITPGAAAGETIRLALEAYAGHPCEGSQPFDSGSTQNRYPARYPKRFEAMEIAVRRDDIMGFVFDLKTLAQLFGSLPENSFRRGKIARVLEAVFQLVPQDPKNRPESVWRPPLMLAREAMAEALASPAEPSAPMAGLVGHSHLDTAWMWTLDETARKAARTYSNVLSLMDQYPEFTFIQSTPFHAELMRRHYPAVWNGIVKRVAEGRWEPNGGMWIECDCNLTGGESMVRQFLKGIRFTREHFGYTPDTFWLPDTFGYNAAIPQIMLGCGLKYFLTTKLTWNEVNTFPYDTFWWQGLDGSRVLAHFNDIQCWPDPETLLAKLQGGGPKDFRSVENFIQHKDVNDRRLISYGMGDGGGGPQFEMIEMARRCRDLEGCPRASHTTVSQFMRELEETAVHPPLHVGELYVEGHRGSLTSIHQIKRGNRKAEIALRDAEILLVANGREADAPLRARLSACWETLLINQFHDILPGTSIPEVHDRAVSELEEVIQEARRIAGEAAGPATQETRTLWNTLSWDRTGCISIPAPAGDMVPGSGVRWQKSLNIDDEPTLVVQAAIPSLGALEIPMERSKKAPAVESPFRYDGKSLASPHLTMEFDRAGRITSLRTHAANREVCLSGGTWNGFLFGEDVPEAWDNWDIDDDQALKLAPQEEMLSREVVADGPLQFRLRSTFRIGSGSHLTQDLILNPDNPRVDFESRLDWRERHALLKVRFQTPILPQAARHEIPFGHVMRPAFRNNRFEAVKFEVCNHKWTDLSENRHGVAILNDCKYGISVAGGEMRLTLMKGGLHPDPRGDAGVHKFTYSLLPHEGGFSAETVIRQAYELNTEPVCGSGRPRPPLFTISESNIICEAVKPAEDGNGYMVRLYEAEGSSGRASLRFRERPGSVSVNNLLEEDLGNLPVAQNAVEIDFHAFEIVTLRVAPM